MDSGRDARADSGADASQGLDSGGGGAPDYLEALASHEDYLRMQGDAGTIKYLLRVDGREPLAPLVADCTFQNTRRFPYHLPFMRGFSELASLDLDTYVSLVMHQQTRVWWAGGLAEWRGSVHPLSGVQGVISYTVYVAAGSAEMLTVDQALEIHLRLESCMPYATQQLAMLPETPEQASHLRGLSDELSALGVALIFPEDLIP